MDRAANAAYGQAVLPHLQTALTASPPELAAPLRAIEPVIAAVGNGESLPADDSVMAPAVASYEAWAHANCGYQTVELMAMDYEFDGIPEALTAGPTSFSVMNHSERGETHVATLARRKPGVDIGVKELFDLSLDQISQYVDVIPTSAVVAAGATSGLLVDLTPGHYFLLCPMRSQEDDPSSGHLLRGMLSEFDVV